MKKTISTLFLIILTCITWGSEPANPTAPAPAATPTAPALVDLESGKVSFVLGQGGKITGNNQPLKVGDRLPEKTDLETGVSPVTEIIFADGSVMRLGQKTKVSFLAKERVVRLESGTVLVYSPEGNGGISIQGGKVVGRVSGSTIMGTMDAPGNFSFFVLESSGAGSVTPASAPPTFLGVGEGTTIRAAGGETPEVMDLHVDAIRDISPLFQQIPTPLPSDEKVVETTRQQGQDVQSDVKLLSSLENYKLTSADPEGVALSMICAVGQDEMGAAKNILLRPLDTAAGTETASGQSSAGSPGGQTPMVISVATASSLTDARQPEASLVVASSSPPSLLGDGLGATSTAAGEGGGGSDPSETDTAAGGGAPPDSQPPPTLQPANVRAATPF